MMYLGYEKMVKVIGKLKLIFKDQVLVMLEKVKVNMLVKFVLFIKVIFKLMGGFVLVKFQFVLVFVEDCIFSSIEFKFDLKKVKVLGLFFKVKSV